MARAATAMGSAALAVSLLAGDVAAMDPAAVPEETPRSGVPGDVERGRSLVLDRERGNCGACHSIPGAADTAQSTMGPSLAGVAGRLRKAQVRYIVVDPRRLRPATIMPAYHRTEGLVRVARPLAGKPILSSDEVEDVVAYLMTLRE